MERSLICSFDSHSSSFVTGYCEHKPTWRRSRAPPLALYLILSWHTKSFIYIVMHHATGYHLEPHSCHYHGNPQQHKTHLGMSHKKHATKEKPMSAPSRLDLGLTKPMIIICFSTDSRIEKN